MGGSSSQQRWREKNPEAVEQSRNEDCPTCQAKPGEPCRTKDGEPFKTWSGLIHIPRLEAASRTNMKRKAEANGSGS